MTVDNLLTVTDVDSTNLVSATVEIVSGFVDGDALNFTDQLGITGTYDSGTGVLTLTGTASLADYQTALRSVEFESSSDDPGPSRTIRFRGFDGDEIGVPADRSHRGHRGQRRAGQHRAERADARTRTPPSPSPAQRALGRRPRRPGDDAAGRR